MSMNGSALVERPLDAPHTLVAPFDEEMERSVLGSILVSPSIHPAITAILNTDDFFLLRHQYIFDAMKRISLRNEIIERKTLAKELQDRNQFEVVGGHIYISDLMSSVSSIAYAEQYAEHISRMAVRQRGLVAADKIKALYLDMDMSTEEALSNAEACVHGVRESWQSETAKTGSAITDALFDLLEAESPPVVPIPFARLQEMVGGFRRGNLSILAAPSGLGKTFTALNIGAGVCKMKKTNNKPFRVLIFSLEMITETELLPRWIAMESGVPEWKILSAKKYIMNDDAVRKQYTDGVAKIAEYKDNLIIDDRSTITPAYVRSQVMRHKPDLVIIDYLTLMDDDQFHGNSAHAKFGTIIKSLKEVAKDSASEPQDKAAFLVLSQLNRTAIRDTRQNKAPQNIGDIAPSLEALKESGDIENHAALVLMLAQDDDMEASNLIGVCVRKNRFGLKWFNGKWKEYPPLLHRHPETGLMKCAGAAKMITGQGND